MSRRTSRGRSSLSACRNQIINIGGDTIYRVNELAYAVMEAMDLPGVVRYVATRNEARHAFANHDKTHRICDQQALTSLDAGLRAMAGWAGQAGIRKSRRFDNVEIADKLPPVWLED